MYLNAHTIILTLFIILFGCYSGLQLVRKFALQIAQENHDAIIAMDNEDNEKHLRRVHAADVAAATAYAKVQPLLSLSSSSSQQQQSTSSSTTGTTTTTTNNNIPSAPASGSLAMV